MKKLRMLTALLLMTVLMVACGSKETITVCENTKVEAPMSVWKTEFKATGDKVEEYTWTVVYTELDVDDINDEEQVKQKLKVLTNAKNYDENEFRTITYDISAGSYGININYKDLQNADEDQLEALGLDENMISLEKRLAIFEDNDAIVCTVQ